MTGPGTNLQFGLTMRFQVVVDGLSLGQWSSCRGLELKCAPVKFRDHGNPYYEEILPGEISYPPITLERAMDATSSKAVQEWLGTTFKSWLVSATTYTGGTAQITLLDATAKPVMTWSLMSVYPTAWKGPTLSAKDNNVAIETLELTHAGFVR